MRQKRRGGWIRSVVWASGLTAGCGLAAAGLWMFGVIDIGDSAGLLHKGQAKEAAATGQGEASALHRSPNPSASADASPSPSASPKIEGAAAGDGLLGQSTNTAQVTEAAKKWLIELAKVSLQPHEFFSLDEWVKSTAEIAKLEKPQEDLSHIASLLYEAALRGGMSIGERHTHGELPAYAMPGFDVAYRENAKNLTLSNPFDFPVQLGTVTTEQTPPAVYFKGSPNAKWAPVKLEVAVEPVQADKVEMVDFSLGIGKGETIRQEEKKGMLVLVKAKEADITRVVAKDYYAPTAAVVARGPTAEELKETGH